MATVHYLKDYKILGYRLASESFFSRDFTCFRECTIAQNRDGSYTFYSWQREIHAGEGETIRRNVVEIHIDNGKMLLEACLEHDWWEKAEIIRNRLSAYAPKLSREFGKCIEG